MRYPCILIMSNKRPLPLKKVEYNVAINGGLANVALSQTYVNTSGRVQDVTYKFPISSKLVFGGIEAIFRNRRVEGLIKKKAEAKAEFIQNKIRGNTVAYAEQLVDTQDIMRLELGNLPAGEVLTITFKYYMNLDVINNLYWGFRIPLTLIPRYNPKVSIDDYTGLQPGAEGTGIPMYNWDINININWPNSSPISIQCPSHQNDIIIKQNPGFANLKFDKSKRPLFFPDRDFCLTIKDENLFSNACSVAMADLPTIKGKTPKYAAMLQFVPSMYEWYQKAGPSDQGVDIYEDENDDFLMGSTQAEYIFVLDRSGSMSGKTMKRAKEALVLFLNSLPMGSKFNIVSFGSRYSFMFKKGSVDYNSDNLSKAIKKIKKMKADYGGTEILEPLAKAYRMPRVPNYQRNVFLLTDGAVSNTRELVNFIESNSFFNSVRVFSIGIGSGCSEALVHKTAKAGNGKSVIIMESKGIQSKVISLLNESLTPSLTNFVLDFDPKYIAALSPCPSKYSHVIRGEPFIMYALLKNDIEQAPKMTTTVRVSFYDSVKKQNEVRKFELSLSGCIVNNNFHRMCIKNLIDCNESIKQGYYLDPTLLSSKNIYENLAIAYQVLSPKYTAFICVISRNNGRGSGREFITPSIEQDGLESDDSDSSDYSDSDSSPYGRRIKRKMFKRKKKKKKAKMMVRPEKELKMKMRSRNVDSLQGLMKTKKKAIPIPRSNALKAKRSIKKKESSKKSEKMMRRSKERARDSSIKMPSRSNMQRERMKQRGKRRGKGIEDESEEDEDSFDDEIEKEYSMDDMADFDSPVITEKTKKSNHNLVKNSSNLPNLQNIDGSWDFSKSTIRDLGLRLNKIQGIRSAVNNDKTVMTIIVLTYLILFADKTAMSMIIKKGKGYLRKANKPKYRQWIDEAKKLF